MKNNTFYIYQSLLVVFLLCFSTIGFANNTLRFYEYCASFPSETLIEMGNVYSIERNLHDSALVCYKTVIDRTLNDTEEQSKELCIEAYIAQWKIYFFHYYNYSTSLECLFQAHRLNEQLKLQRPDIYLDLGVTYHTIAEECQDTTLYRQALSFYSKALEQSFHTNTDILDITMTNLITTANVLDSMQVVQRVWENYRAMEAATNMEAYNTYLYNAIQYQRKGQYQHAIDQLLKQVQICGDDPTYTRYLTLTYIHIGKVFLAFEHTDKAITFLQKAEYIAQHNDFKDAKFEVYNLLSECYKRQGDTNKFVLYKDKYFNIKDTLLNSHQLKRVSEVHVMDDIRRMDTELTKMRYRHKLFSWLLWVFIVVFMVVSLLLCILFIKNKRLNQSYHFLYERNLEMLRNDANHMQTYKARPQQVEMSMPIEKDELEQSPITTIDNADDIYLRIKQVLETDSTVFTPDFSMETLSALVGEKQRTISQVIHYKTNANFYSMLSECRIKEVCKRFQDEENYHKLTIEAIAHSVGFKSRSNFCASFKNIVGLNPSEYIKMIKEQS